MNNDESTLDNDLKKILLNPKPDSESESKPEYEDDSPILNILKAKHVVKDNKKDYAYKEEYPGHVENYKVVDDVFKRLYPEGETMHKDIMNSFWVTYKNYLQIEYNTIFMANGKIDPSTPALTVPKKIKKPSIQYPPFTKGDYEKVGTQYSEYYDKHYPYLEVNADDTWVKFLEKNFRHFMKVNESAELKTFARLTHTIGNIDVVPKGFNGGRGASDYWDWALVSLRGFLMTVDENTWKLYVHAHYLEVYVNASDYRVIPFWENHLSTEEIHHAPKTLDEIQSFLKNVNRAIRLRGERIMNVYHQKK